MTHSTPTDLWNDSANPQEIKRAIEYGAVGATCNPVLAFAAIKANNARWTNRILQLAASKSDMNPSEIGWQVVEELSQDSARLLMPAFEQYSGKNGRLSIQTDPRLYSSAQSIVDQAVAYSKLAPNIIVKIPATTTGLAAIEEATFRGVSVNVTVSFTTAQAIAAADAIERGLRRRESTGGDTTRMGPVVTIMVGRLDDWLRNVVKAQKIEIDPGLLDWAGVATFKNAYDIFCRREFRARLLVAAFRSTLHLTEFVGGDVVVSAPPSWQTVINDLGLPLEERIDVPVDDQIIATLLDRVGEFRRAYEPDGLPAGEFDTFGATTRTIQEFLGATVELDTFVDDVLASRA